MEIKDFIEESLLQFVDGIANTHKSLAQKGAYIPIIIMLVTMLCHENSKYLEIFF